MRVFKCLTHSPAYCARPKEGLQSQKPKPEDLKLATADFEKAVAADSSYTKAHYRLATALFKQNKIEGALAALGPALVRLMGHVLSFSCSARGLNVAPIHHLLNRPLLQSPLRCAFEQAAEPDSKPITALRDKLVKLQQKGKGTSTISFSQKDRDREDPKKQREEREKAVRCQHHHDPCWLLSVVQMAFPLRLYQQSHTNRHRSTCYRFESATNSGDQLTYVPLPLAVCRRRRRRRGRRRRAFARRLSRRVMGRRGRSRGTSWPCTTRAS